MNRTETLDAARHAVTGRKDDSGKLRYDLEPQDARAGMIGVLTDGAVKYGVRNWEAGMDWSRVYAAAQRHLAAWWAGEDKDPETGRPHLDHAACCIAFLSAYEKRGVGKDDRPAHIAQGGRCVSDAGLDGKTVAENINANTDPFKSGCDDEGWIDHDGGGKCPVSDDLLKVDIEYAGGNFYYGFTAASRDWRGVKRWRVAEVDGWVRWSGGPKPLFPANSVFRVVFRNGLAHCHWRPDALNWPHSGSNFDIIAYRPA